MGEGTNESLVEYRLKAIETGQERVLSKIDELAEKFVSQSQMKANNDRFDERLRAQDDMQTAKTNAVVADLDELKTTLEKGHGIRSNWWLWAAGAAVTVSVTVLGIVGTAVVTAIQKYLETH